MVSDVNLHPYIKERKLQNIGDVKLLKTFRPNGRDARPAL